MFPFPSTRSLFSLFVLDFERWVIELSSVCSVILGRFGGVVGGMVYMCSCGDSLLSLSCVGNLSVLLCLFWEKMCGFFDDPRVVVTCGKRKMRSWFWRIKAGIRRSRKAKQRFSFHYDPFSYALNFDNGDFGFFC